MQQITRGDYLKDLITIYIENNLQTDLTDLYESFIFQCGDIQQFLTPAQVIKISLNEQESQLLKNTNVTYLAGITKDGHKETFNGSLSFNTRGEVVYYEPPVSTVTPSTTVTETTCGCRGINGFFSNCSQPAIKAYFTLNYVPTKLSELTNDTDFQDGADIAESISLHNTSTEAHTYIQSLIANNTEAIALETSTRASETEALSISIGAETTAREEAVSLAIQTTEAYTDTIVSSATTAINTTIGTLASLTTTSTTDIVSAINSEVSDRQGADSNLQTQIDGLAAASDVKDIVGTYADLENYDTSHLGNNDIIKVLTDETHNNQPSYYRYNKSTDTFSYIGSESAAYTKAQSDSIFVTKTTTINNKALSSDITLSASDVSALPSTTTINDLTTTAQQNALNSGVTSTVVAQVGTNTSAIASNTSAITGLKDLSNLTATGEARLHALKSYADKGELLTDAEGLADVIEYAHSSFDKSKFIKSGSPIISDSGLAYGFTSGNTLSANVSIGATDNFTFIIPVMVTDSVSTTRGIGNLRNTSQDDQVVRMRIESSRLRVNGFGGAIGNFDSRSNTISTNAQYYIKVDRNGNTVTINYYDENFNKITDTTLNETFDITGYTINSIDLLRIGLIASTAGKEGLVINLKEIDLRVNGLPVFSGHKTGIGIIKPINFTTVANNSANTNPILPFSSNGLTITEDGIAKGFQSGTNYLRTPIKTTDLLNKSWKVETRFKPADVISPYALNMFKFTDPSSQNGAQGNGGMGFNANTKYMVFQYKTGDSSESSSNSYKQISLANYMNEYVTASYEFDIITGTYTFKAYRENGTLIGTQSYAAITTNKQLYYINTESTYIITIGTGYSGTDTTGGNIDLNGYKIHANGDLIYQPLLRIPYTQSSNQYGAKVVDSVYRDRVTDAWEQGYGNRYYTLDETNGKFTLPMGDVYGLIESSIPNYIGKNILSIGVFGGSFATNNYAQTAFNKWIEKLGVSYKTYAVGGAGFVQGTNFVTQATNAGVHDIYVIWCSTNDFTNSNAIGTSSDVYGTDTTCWANFKEVVRLCYAKNPKAKICLFTSSPHLSSSQGNEEGRGSTTTYTNTLKEHVEAQKAMCAFYSLPCLDQYNNSQQNGFNYNLVTGGSGFHLTPYGYELLANRQIGFLAEL